MTSIPTRDPKEAPVANASNDTGSSVSRVVTFAKCLRCEFEWLPRKATPVKCPNCQSALWNVPRANRKEGKPAPTRKGKPRGRSMPKTAVEE